MKTTGQHLELLGFENNLQDNLWVEIKGAYFISLLEITKVVHSSCRNVN